MKKTITCLFCVICGTLNTLAQTTAGDGSVYNFEKLSQISDGLVTKEGDRYIMNGTFTIAEKDSFKIDDNAIIAFCDEAELIIKGHADLRAGSTTTLCRLGESANCQGIHVQTEGQRVEVANLVFDYVGLRSSTTVGMNVSGCTFTNHNGTASSALFVGGNGASFHISGCHFDHCQKAAIGGAANFLCPMTIEDCTFKQNSQANGNVPQLNLTAASEIIIKNCTVEGDPNLNMVGGIGLANWYGTPGLNVVIDNCDIRDNRYGITTMGVMDARITNNNIVNNKYETNPNNGGSGISLYDPYMKQTAYVSGNNIEGNLWGITVIGCGQVNIGKTEVASDAADYNPGNNTFKDNGNQGVKYDIYNNSANTVYAQGNIWSVEVQDAASIEEVIFHHFDNEALGEVIYMPAGDPANIEKHTTERQASSTIYKIDGTPMGNSLERLPAGLYIIDGKKVVK